MKVSFESETPCTIKVSDVKTGEAFALAHKPEHIFIAIKMDMAFCYVKAGERRLVLDTRDNAIKSLDMDQLIIKFDLELIATSKAI